MHSTAFTVWITGLPGAGKAMLAGSLKTHLTGLGVRAELLDRETVSAHLGRAGLNLSNGPDDVAARVGWACEKLNRIGVSAIVAVDSPGRELREHLRGRMPNFVEVYMRSSILSDLPLPGLPPLAGTAGEAAFEPPLHAEVILQSVGGVSPIYMLRKVIDHLSERGWLPEPVPA